MYTLKILECNEISIPHQMTKKRIEELVSRYFFVSNIFLFRLEYLILALNRECAFPCLYTFVHLSLVVILTFFYHWNHYILVFCSPRFSLGEAEVQFSNTLGHPRPQGNALGTRMTWGLSTLGVRELVQGHPHKMVLC